MNNFIFSSSIIKNEFFILTKIIQNIKLIEYIIKGKLQRTEDNEKEIILNNKNIFENKNDNSFIKVNDEFKVVLKKLKDDEISSNLNLFDFKIMLLKIKEDNMTIQLKVIFNKEENKNNYYNIITIFVRKLTANSSFVFIKYILDYSINDNYIKFFLNKCLHNIDKLCKTAKKY